MVNRDPYFMVYCIKKNLYNPTNQGFFHCSGDHSAPLLAQMVQDAAALILAELEYETAAAVLSET